MKIVFTTMALAAGAAVALQASANAGLSRAASLGPALVINTFVVLVGACSLWLVLGAKMSFFPPGTSWTLYLGGVFGFLIISTTAIVFPRLGAAWAVSLIVLGQSASALMIDRFGLLGMTPIAITPKRLLGMALVVTGVAVFRL